MPCRLPPAISTKATLTAGVSTWNVSLAVFFLMLNVISLDSIRWSREQTGYRRKVLLTAGLIGLNLVLLNVWLYPLSQARVEGPGALKARLDELGLRSAERVADLRRPGQVLLRLSRRGFGILLAGA